MGPQCSGLLLGTKELIEAGMPCMSPSGGIGRGMKVGKEEMVGLLAAVERYLKVDHDAEIRELDRRVSAMMETLGNVKGLKLERHIPVIANEVPHLMVTWDEKALNIATGDVVKKLAEGEPSIAILPQGTGAVLVSVWMLRGEEHKI